MAALAVAKAAPDGYTLLLTGTNHATNPTLIPDAGFDYERDLAPVTMVAEANMLLVAHPSLPANNVAELVALAKQKPIRSRSRCRRSARPIISAPNCWRRGPAST